LPEGTRVCVSVLPPSAEALRIERAAQQFPLTLPIFDYDGPPDIELTNDRIAEILDHDDMVRT